MFKFNKMSNNTVHKPILLKQPWSYLIVLQILMAMALVNRNVDATYVNGVTPDDEYKLIIPNDTENEIKRNWQSLQGPWGKRAENDVDINVDLLDMEEVMPVLITSNLEQPQPKMQLAFLVNPAALERILSFQMPLPFYEDTDLENENILNQKRGWKKMNVAWGKRRSSGPPRNRDSGSFGKREPNWNNLRGMWGKRSTNGWHKLNNGWGKRSVQFPETN